MQRTLPLAIAILSAASVAMTPVAMASGGASHSEGATSHTPEVSFTTGPCVSSSDKYYQPAHRCEGGLWYSCVDGQWAGLSRPCPSQLVKAYQQKEMGHESH